VIVSQRDTLHHWLQSYAPSDVREQTFHSSMLQLLGSAGDPFARSHFTPGHFTASAFILSPDRQRVLLIFHSKLERWLQPGGHVSVDDTDVLAAARREVAEEVALTDVTLARDGIFDIDVHDIPPLRGEPAHQHFDVRFLFLAPSLTMSAGSDATAARWLTLSDLVDSTTDESVLRALRKLV
jgi:8-oxo-dGTP pyrophosphatase MutT (NUDIX family)